MTKIACALLLIFCVATTQAQISFKANVDKLQGAFEDDYGLTLEVSVTDPSVETTPVPPPEIMGFRIGGSGSSVARQDGATIRKYTYSLKPVRSGEVTIPAFKVEFKSAQGVDTLSSEPIVVSIAQPKPVRSQSSLDWLYIVIGVVVVAAVGTVFYTSRRRKPVVGLEPDWKIEAQAKFSDIRKLAEREDFREFCGQGSKFIIGLLERRHEARLTGYTLTDVLRWMEEQGLDADLRGRSKELFEFCEEVKFTTGKVDVQKGQMAAANAAKIVELILK